MRPSFEGGGVREPSGCQSCQEKLSAYIDAELDMVSETASETASFADIKVHLEKCQQCQESYENLMPVLLMERRGALYLPPIEVHFDFSYLEKSTSQDSIWYFIERAGRQVAKLFTELNILVNVGFAFFDQLPSPLVVKWQVAPMATRARDQQERVPILSFPSPEHDLSLSLSVIPPTSQETNPTLTIEATLLSSLKPIRARVILRDVQYRLLQSRLTNQDGEVSFANMKPAFYVLEVKYRRQVLELPITVTWQA